MTLYMLLYMFIIFMFFSSMSFLFVWMILEVLSMMFINIIYIYNTNKTSSYSMSVSYSTFSYFVYQMTFSLILLVFIISNSSYSIISSEIFLSMFPLIMFIKMGSLPYFLWVTKTTESIDGMSFSVLMTLHKLPMLLILLNFFSNTLLLLMVLNLIGGAMLLLSSFSIKNILIMSSMYNLFWMLVIFFNSEYMFMVFYSMYSISIFMVNSMDLFKKVNLEMNFIGNITLTMIMMMFISSPPFGMFFMKFFSFMSFSEYLSNFILLVTMIFMLATYGYIKFFYKCMVLSEKIYSMNIMYKSNFLVVTLISIFIMYF